jgi:hypothetical protein
MPFNWIKSKFGSTDRNSQGPDYTTIDSNEKAIALYQKGNLVKLYLMPIEFGGQDIAMNCVYVPQFVQIFKERFDLMVGKMVEEGKQLNYSASPQYKGNSFIPSQILISVTGDAQFSEEIKVW